MSKIYVSVNGSCSLSASSRQCLMTIECIGASGLLRARIAPHGLKITLSSPLGHLLVTLRMNGTASGLSALISRLWRQ